VEVEQITTAGDTVQIMILPVTLLQAQKEVLKHRQCRRICCSCSRYQTANLVKHNSINKTSSMLLVACYYTVNHKKGTLFILGITWPNVDQTVQYLAEM